MWAQYCEGIVALLSIAYCYYVSFLVQVVKLSSTLRQRMKIIIFALLRDMLSVILHIDVGRANYYITISRRDMENGHLFRKELVIRSLIDIPQTEVMILN